MKWQVFKKDISDYQQTAMFVRLILLTLCKIWLSKLSFYFFKNGISQEFSNIRSLQELILENKN